MLSLHRSESWSSRGLTCEAERSVLSLPAQGIAWQSDTEVEIRERPVAEEIPLVFLLLLRSVQCDLMRV